MIADAFFALLVIFIMSFAIFGVLVAFESKSIRDRSSAYVAVVCSFIAVAWATTPFFVPQLAILFHPSSKGTLSDYGSFGDMFGAATSLFSGLAFVGLIWTLVMQREELGYQRRELSETRDEFERQRFESTLFSILRMISEQVSTLEFEPDWPDDRTVFSFRGKAVLEYYSSELQDELNILDDGSIDQNYFFSKNEQISGYIQLYGILFESDLASYYRLLYQAFSHIDRSNFADAEKIRYSKIVRATLGPSELKLLFFNCETPMGEGFKKWVEKYSVLKHLRRTDKEKNPSLRAAYDPRAFDDD